MNRLLAVCLAAALLAGCGKKALPDFPPERAPNAVALPETDKPRDFR